MKFLNEILFSFSQEETILVVNFLNNTDSHVTDRMSRQVEMPSNRTVFVLLNISAVTSKALFQSAVGFPQILQSAAWLKTSNAVDDIAGVTVHRSIDIHGEVCVCGSDCPASLDIGTVDTLATSLHTRQHSSLSGGGRRDLGTDDKLSDILLSPICNERRSRKYLTEHRVLHHHSPMLLGNLIG